MMGLIGGGKLFAEWRTAQGVEVSWWSIKSRNCKSVLQFHIGGE